MSGSAVPRVAVLGTGAMGRLHVRVLSDLRGEVELVGVYDPNYALARDAAQRTQVPVFAREDDAIAASDFVVVASPIAAHAATVVRALAAHRSALVEKPLCARHGQAVELCRAVRPGRQLFVGHSERFNPVVRTLRRLVRPEEIVSLDLRRLSPPVARATERAVLLSLGVHDLDLAGYLTASLVEIREARGTEDGWARLELGSPSGATIRICLDRTARAREREIEVATADAVFSGDLLAPRLVRTSRASGRVEEVELGDEEPLVAQARAVAEALAGEPIREVATAADGARALALAEEARDWLIPAQGVARVPAAS